MLNVDQTSVLDAHMGRGGDNKIQTPLALQQGRLVLAKLAENKISILTSDRTPEAIEQKLAEIEAGKCRLVRVQGFPDGILGSKRQDGIAFTTDDGYGGNVDRFELHWQVV